MTNPVQKIIALAKKGDRRVLIGGGLVIGGGVGLFVFLKNRKSGSGGVSALPGLAPTAVGGSGADGGGGGGGGGGGDLSGLGDLGSGSADTTGGADLSLPSLTDALNSPTDQAKTGDPQFLGPASPVGDYPGLGTTDFSNLPSLLPTISPITGGDYSLPALPSYSAPGYTGGVYGNNMSGADPTLIPQSGSVDSLRSKTVAPAADQSFAYTNTPATARNQIAETPATARSQQTNAGRSIAPTGPADPVGRNSSPVTSPAVPVGRNFDANKSPAEPVGRNSSPVTSPAVPVGRNSSPVTSPAEPVARQEAISYAQRVQDLVTQANRQAVQEAQTRAAAAEAARIDAYNRQVQQLIAQAPVFAAIRQQEAQAQATARNQQIAADAVARNQQAAATARSQEAAATARSQEAAATARSQEAAATARTVTMNNPIRRTQG